MASRAGHSGQIRPLRSSPPSPVAPRDIRDRLQAPGGTPPACRRRASSGACLGAERADDGVHIDRGL
jgi:hypothetical protein